MQFTVKTTTGLERRIEVEIPHTRVAGEVDRRLRDLSRTANIRGFRKGKVPLAVVKQQYGSQVHGDAVSELIRQSYSDAVNKENLRPASGPRIEPIQIEPGNDLKFAAVFEVMPEISVKPVDDLAIERPTTDVTEADIDAMIESMRRQRVTYSAVDRAAQKGDRVTVDFAGRVDGVAFDGGTGTDMQVVIGSGRAIADFEAALIGMSRDEKKTAPVKFPDNYGAKELAGKNAEFDLTVKSVEGEELPAVDEAFAQAFGLADGGIEALRGEVRKSMEREALQAVRTKLRNQVFEALQRDNPVELPRSMVDEQVQQLQIDLLQRMGREDMSQMPPREPFEEPARRRVALGLIVGEIARRENLQADRNQVFARLEEVAASYPDPEQVKRAYLQNADAMRQIETGVVEEQVVNWVLGKARVTDRPISFADLTGFGKQA
ncbi:MAG TPA: trigger factor [Steroidobacteraceae bacterium]|nr:trigger factor [Steroidobacteraceae bacterium]